MDFIIPTFKQSFRSRHNLKNASKESIYQLNKSTLSLWFRKEVRLRLGKKLHLP